MHLCVEWCPAFLSVRLSPMCHAGHPQEDAGRGQHAGAVQHGDEADREEGHAGQAHHDRRHGAHLCRHLPGHQIPRLSKRQNAPKRGGVFLRRLSVISGDSFFFFLWTTGPPE